MKTFCYIITFIAFFLIIMAVAYFVGIRGILLNLIGLFSFILIPMKTYSWFFK